MQQHLKHGETGKIVKSSSCYKNWVSATIYVSSGKHQQISRFEKLDLNLSDMAYYYF